MKFSIPSIDIYWHDTMIVLSWYVVAGAGSLLLVLVAGVALVVWLVLRDRAR